MGRRAVAAVLTLCLAGSISASNGAFGDPIGDKRTEARAVADELEQLRREAEVAAERYNDARLELAEVEKKVEAAAAQARRTQSQLTVRRKELAGYAVTAYVRGEDGAGVSVVLGAEDGTDIERRRGYAEAAMGDRADLVDRLRAAEASAEHDVARSTAARSRAEKAKAKVEAMRRAAEEAVHEQRARLAEVQGELARLVKAEEARRAAAAALRAREAARRLAAETAARAASQRRAEAAALAQAATPTPTTSPTTTSSSTSSDRAPAVDESTLVDPSTPAARRRRLLRLLPHPSVGVGAEAAIAAARSVLGVRYTWAGASPSTGFDCSGLVLWAWQHGGKSLPHSSRAMYSSSRRISMSDIQPGDLIFYGQPTIHHVALYVGGGQIIHAARFQRQVRQCLLLGRVGRSRAGLNRPAHRSSVATTGSSVAAHGRPAAGLRRGLLHPRGLDPAGVPKGGGSGRHRHGRDPRHHPEGG
ncbi:MAG: NlpC/P60 family protein [Acidimicrobiales bacterium]